MLEHLTDREWEIAALVATGLSNREVAEGLVVAETTVRAHLRIIYGKLGLRNRVQLAVWFAEHREDRPIE